MRSRADGVAIYVTSAKCVSVVSLAVGFLIRFLSVLVQLIPRLLLLCLFKCQCEPSLNFPLSVFYIWYFDLVQSAWYFVVVS